MRWLLVMGLKPTVLLASLTRLYNCWWSPTTPASWQGVGITVLVLPPGWKLCWSSVFALPPGLRVGQLSLVTISYDLLVFSSSSFSFCTIETIMVSMLSYFT